MQPLEWHHAFKVSKKTSRAKSNVVDLPSVGDHSLTLVNDTSIDFVLFSAVGFPASLIALCDRQRAAFHWLTIMWINLILQIRSLKCMAKLISSPQTMYVLLTKQLGGVMAGFNCRFRYVNKAFSSKFPGHITPVRKKKWTTKQ